MAKQPGKTSGQIKIIEGEKALEILGISLFEGEEFEECDYPDLPLIQAALTFKPSSTKGKPFRWQDRTSWNKATPKEFKQLHPSGFVSESFFFIEVMGSMVQGGVDVGAIWSPSKETGILVSVEEDGEYASTMAGFTFKGEPAFSKKLIAGISPGFHDMMGTGYDHIEVENYRPDLLSSDFFVKFYMDWREKTPGTGELILIYKEPRPE